LFSSSFTHILLFTQSDSQFTRALLSISQPHYVLVKALEIATLLLQELVWLAILDQRTLLHNDDLVEVENSVELVRDGDDSMCSELLAQEALNDGVRLRIETVDHVSQCGTYDLEVGLTAT
jgi:DNA-binding GntR family transcriptional regulator